MAPSPTLWRCLRAGGNNTGTVELGRGLVVHDASVPHGGRRGTGAARSGECRAGSKRDGHRVSAVLSQYLQYHQPSIPRVVIVCRRRVAVIIGCTIVHIFCILALSHPGGSAC
ncbi:unnamed protein product, partial [Iphiclides podalirius]